MKPIKFRFLKVFLWATVLAPGIASGQEFTLADLPTGTTDPQEASVEITNTSDPANHSCCVIAPPSLMEIFMQEGELVIRETGGANSVPWLDFDPMAVDSNLQFSSQNRATVAGFSNILTVLTGTISRDSITGQITIGADGGLPTGASLNYDFTLSPIAGTEWFFTNTFSIRAQVGISFALLADQEIPRVQISGPDDALEMFLSIDINGEEGDADWWIVMLSEDGDFFSFDLATGGFVPGLMPTAQGPLVDVPEPISVLDTLFVPTNNTTIVFGVDRDPNGVVDLDSLQGRGFTFWF